MMEATIRSLDELAHFARNILSWPLEAEGAVVFALAGELGAGKTTFVQTIAKALGVKEQVTSPTFLIMKRYAIPRHRRFRTLVHIDAYRVEDPQELSVLGFERELANYENLIAIEWPERVTGLIPPDAEHFVFEFRPDGSRTIRYDSNEK